MSPFRKKKLKFNKKNIIQLNIHRTSQTIKTQTSYYKMHDAARYKAKAIPRKGSTRVSARFE